MSENILPEFEIGLFVVRRSNSFCAGVTPDLCIEQI